MNSSTTTDTCVDKSGCRVSCDFEILRHSSLFSGINHDVVKLIAYLCQHRTFRAGDYLIKQNKTAGQAFLLIKGEVEISVFHKDKEVILQPLSAGSFFGELALLAEFKWFFSARTSSDTEVLIIDRTAFQKIIEKFPEHRDKLIERIVKLRIERLVGQTEYMIDQMAPANQNLITAIV